MGHLLLVSTKANSRASRVQHASTNSSFSGPARESGTPQTEKLLGYKSVATARIGSSVLLGGSWVVINRVISPLIWVISIVILLRTLLALLTTTHKPPSRGRGFRVFSFVFGGEGRGLGMCWDLGLGCDTRMPNLGRKRPPFWYWEGL